LGMTAGLLEVIWTVPPPTGAVPDNETVKLYGRPPTTAGQLDGLQAKEWRLGE
jgi:hypothetical protein